MIRADLQQLIANCDDDQCEILAGIVLRLISVKVERWTGNVAFTVNMNCGSIVDMHISTDEIFRPTSRKRKKNDTVLSVV